MPVIEVQTKHAPKGFYDFILEDDDGMVSDTIKIETTELLCEGDLCEVHLCDYNGDPHILKLAKVAADNDLVQNEGTILQALFSGTKDNFSKLLPTLKYSGLWENRAYNVFPYYREWICLEQVLAAYPKGIDYRDAIWMYKRILGTVGFAHQRGIVHGAITPAHILIHPQHHGAKVLDWSYAVATPEHAITPGIGAICNKYRAYYPPEVFEKRPAHPITDIYMATMVLTALLGGDVEKKGIPVTVPDGIRQLLLSCLYADGRRRPQNAWDFHAELDKVLQKVVGPPTYRVFKLPDPKP